MFDGLSQFGSQAFAERSAWIYLASFAFGLAASITPCTYPVLPLTVSYIGNMAGGRRGWAAILSGAMVVSMAMVYAVLGVILTATGQLFGQLAGKGWFMASIAGFFVLMSLFLLDVFEFPQFGALSRLQGKAAGRRGLGGAIVVGAVSGLVVGPCTGPLLAVVLGFVIATLRDATGAAYALEIARGGLLLFLFGLGQGALIMACGVFAGLLTALPKAGQWMVTIKKAFGVLILAAASLLFIYVGQATDFPSLTGWLAGTGPAAAREPAAQTSPPAPEEATSGTIFGGDEFLQ